VKINLGCGSRHLEGYVNVDLVEPADLVLDLSETPWPWDDFSVDRLHADNFFEHFDGAQLTAMFNECHRVLSGAGALHLIVPDAEQWPVGAFKDWTHRTFFVWPGTFQYLDHEHHTHRNYAAGRLPWKIVEGGSDGRFITVTMRPWT
jgi:predicted SAM-dependent methyltransferase